MLSTIKQNTKGILFGGDVKEGCDYMKYNLEEVVMRIFLAFEWDLNDLIKFLPVIARQGFNAIEITPVQPMKQKVTNKDEWWLCFQPLGFRIGNQYGNEEIIMKLCEEAKKYNIRIIINVVLNHVANGYGFEFHPNVDKELTSRHDFWKPRINIDWKHETRYDVIHHCLHNLPGLNLANHDLQQIVFNFLEKCISLGVGGFRFDAAKNIATPNEYYEFSENHSCDFWPRLKEFIGDRDIYNYAEVIYSPMNIIDEYCKYINVITQNVSSNPNKIVSYINNHDTDKEFGVTAHLELHDIISRYEVLCQSFKHTQFFPRPNDDRWADSDVLRRANNYFR